MMTIIFYTIFFFFVFKIIFTFDILLFSFPILNILYILVLHTSFTHAIFNGDDFMRIKDKKKEFKMLQENRLCDTN